MASNTSNNRAAEVAKATRPPAFEALGTTSRMGSVIAPLHLQRVRSEDSRERGEWSDLAVALPGRGHGVDHTEPQARPAQPRLGQHNPTSTAAGSAYSQRRSSILYNAASFSAEERRCLASTNSLRDHRRHFLQEGPRLPRQRPSLSAVALSAVILDQLASVTGPTLQVGT
jgi:hypothetical protein